MPLNASDVKTLSLLDYFAGQALAGLMCPAEWEEKSCIETAEACYIMATAMLNERKRIMKGGL